MPRDSVATKQRILGAAVQEFARHGLAGARVDRIAEESGSNKAMIYRYFDSKDGLFDAVFDAMVVQTVDDVPLDADDLPGYAVRLWDRHRTRPEPIRVAEWDRLERDGVGARSPVVQAAAADKIAAIRAAQRRGAVSADLPAAELMWAVLALSRTCLDDALSPGAGRRHRAAIATAVRRLVHVD